MADAKPVTSRQESLSRRIEEILQAEPGFAQRDLFRKLGEKDILVLSLLDRMVSTGRIVRRGEPTQLYLSESLPSPVPVTVQPPAASPNDARVARTLAVIRTYRFMTRDLGLSIRSLDPMEGVSSSGITVIADVNPEEVSFLVVGGKRSRRVGPVPVQGLSGVRDEILG